MQWIKGLLAGLVLATIVVAPPWALLTYVGNPWPAEGIALSAPLTDGAIVGLLAVVVWLLWAQLIACLLAEAIAVLTDDRIQVVVPLTLGVQQHLARRLITAVVLATVATPGAVPGTTPGAISAAAAAGSTARPTEPARSAVLAASPATQNTTGSAGAESSAPEPARRDSRPTTGTTRHTRGPATMSTAAATTASGSDTANDTATASAATTTVVTVMRLDSLWSIAERHLGSGERWTEVAALNEGRTMNDGMRFVAADHIRPGWELRIPATSASAVEPSPAHTVTVEPGDTLSEIALTELGDAAAYPTLFEASTTLDQPGGAHLTDPDLIHPGWTIVIPNTTPDSKHSGNTIDDSHRADQRDAGDGKDARPLPQRDRRASFAPFPRVVPEPTAPADDLERDSAEEDAEGSAPSSADEPTQDDGADDSSPTLLEMLLAAAGCLSAGALALVLTNRRRQLRRRRVGRLIASTPPDVADTERAVIEHGSAARKDVTFLDRALRHVAASCAMTDQPLPQLGAAVLGVDALTLLFTRPAPGAVPDGWTATDDARAWTLPRSSTLEEHLDAQPAPYPALVSIGQDEDGRTWLLDLESMGVCGISGEPHHVADLARFMVAELAVNRWAEGTEVLLAAPFGEETIDLNPGRIRQLSRTDALARATAVATGMSHVEHNLGADVLTRRRDDLLLDTTHPTVVVTTSRPEQLTALLSQPARSRVVVICGGEEAPAVVLSGDGTALLPAWGVRVQAFTLLTAEARAMAALLATTRNYADEPVPPTRADDGPLGGYARADGSVREEYTQPRLTDGSDASSMLPDADAVYLAAAATTAADLAAAAPSVADDARAELATLDPTLDQDLADWLDPTCPRPKVHLLGPVEVTSLHGGDPTAIDNLGATISFIAYLTCQDHGVTGERAAAECGWKTQRTVQNRATNARFLLGTRPDGSDWLPDASLSAAARRGTSPTYELVRGTGGVLNSADLFIRLRHRAQRRGDTGGCEQDLQTALSLVTGAPFEAATEHRFRWLFKAGQHRHDEILVGAIHDTAHLLATRGLATGRSDLVRLACTTAITASPHADIAWLDLAAVTEADSGRDAALELVRERVLEQLDEDPPARSETIVDRRDWGATA